MKQNRNVYVRLLFSFSGLALFLFNPTAFADVGVKNKFRVEANARVRGEYLDNSAFTRAADQLSFILARFRLGFRFEPIETTSIFIQPQYSGTFGEAVVVNTGSATVTDSSNDPQTVAVARSQQRSGSLFDNSMLVHQAYIEQDFFSRLSLKLGRQELSYGDELLVGAVSWSNVGRSFDALKASVDFDWGETDLFYAKIVDRNISSSGDGDSDFAGVYHKLSPNELVRGVDLYYFYWRDSSGSPDLLALHTVGVRVFGAAPRLEASTYRIESTYQTSKVAGSSQTGFQIDGEVGYDFRWTDSNKFSVEAAYASKNFNQLFPTGHKWLGHLDLFGRRNILALTAHSSNWFEEKYGAKLDIHYFMRSDASRPAYSLNGVSAVGTGASHSRSLGTEVDLVLAYKINSNAVSEFGASFMIPGGYIEDELGEENPYRLYAQLMAKY